MRNRRLENGYCVSIVMMNDCDNKNDAVINYKL